ncbi:MAG: ASKHA domain-containing protein [Anaerolineales bacterium]
MPEKRQVEVTLIMGDETHRVQASVGAVVGQVIAQADLPLEQPCAGRGTCGLCKVLAEGGLAPPDEVEAKHLSPSELALNQRLACRARLAGPASLVLSPTVVYSNKIFQASNRHRVDKEAPLGLAIDLGSTTVAAFITMLDDGEITCGGAALNRQTIYGADVIARLGAALKSADDSRRLQILALASIDQALGSLRLPDSVRHRIERAVVVGNVAMHHLLLGLPVTSLAMLPFQPHQRQAEIKNRLLSGILPRQVPVYLPPMIGGFVGSDALACLAAFGFDHPAGPVAAIDLGTNGEVMISDGQRILTASTAAGPAFEGVNISCGSRAVEGAVVSVGLDNDQFILHTIDDAPPVGLTGSGLLSLVHHLRKEGFIEPGGRFADDSGELSRRLFTGQDNVRRFRLSNDDALSLSQLDVRELQKAKGAIRAAVEILLDRLHLQASDLQQLILTGSFGGQVDVEAVLALGMIPPVDPDMVETIPNGAGRGAALFLDPKGWDLGLRLAERAEQIDLEKDPDFMGRYVSAMRFEANPETSSTL